MHSLSKDQLLAGSLMIVAGILNINCGDNGDTSNASGTKTKAKVSEIVDNVINDLVSGNDGGNGGNSGGNDGNGNGLGADIVKLIKDNMGAIAANLLKMLGGGQGDKEVPKDKKGELESKIKDLLKQIAADKDQLNALIEGKIDALKKTFEGQINGLNSKVDNLTKEVSDLKNKQDNLEDKQNESDKKLKEQEDRIKKLEEVLSELSGEQKEIVAKSGLLAGSNKGKVGKEDIGKVLEDAGKAEWKSYKEFCSKEHVEIYEKLFKRLGLESAPDHFKRMADNNAKTASEYSVKYDARYEQQMREGVEFLFLINTYDAYRKENRSLNISEDEVKKCESFKKEWHRLQEYLKGQGFGQESSFVASMILMNAKVGAVVFDWKKITNDKDVSLGDSFIGSCKNKFSKQLENVQKISKKVQEGGRLNENFDNIFSEGVFESENFNLDSFFSDEGPSEMEAGEGSSKMIVHEGEGKTGKIAATEGSDKVETSEYGYSKKSKEKNGNDTPPAPQTKNADPLAQDIEEFCDYKLNIPHCYCMYAMGFSEKEKEKEKENNTKLKEGIEALKRKGWSDEKIKKFISVDFDKGTCDGSTVAELLNLIYAVSREIDNVKSRQKDLDDVKEGDTLYESRKEWLEQSKKSLDEAIANFKTGYTSITAENKKYTNHILNCYLISNKDEVKSKLGL